MPIELNNYRPNVGVILVNVDGHVWVGERSDIPGAWQMPQGGIDDGESIVDTAYKELEEETGITKDEVVFMGKTDEWSYYNFPEGSEPKESRGQIWKGQKQRWVLLYFKGNPKNIDLHKATDKEFVDWKWVHWKEVLELAVDFRKPSYEKAFAFFSGEFR
jgi:putative (di)nucleoside polyphosphate hydrolase